MKYVSHLNHSSWVQVISTKWWSNQQAALKVIDDYLACKSLRQAMVRMPTGSGKTAVIATLAQLLADHPRCLIVTPSEAFVHQLQREVEEYFWVKVDETKSLKPKPCETFTPASLIKAMEIVKNAGVLICTNKALQMLSTSSELFSLLKQWCNLSLIDEGHREPAPKWAKAIRDLQCPTVLFTATAYRNDLQLFDVDQAFVYTFTFGEALERNIVRNVEFKEKSWNLSGPDYITDFTDKLIQSVKDIEAHPELSKTPIRVIVRCEDPEEIKLITNELKRQGNSAIGIHDTFGSSSDDSLKETVPDPRIEQAQYWVHQNKLIEGFDDPAFRVLAIFSPFGNARNFVQQIGRIVRNSEYGQPQDSFVISHIQHEQASIWDRFIEYENQVQEKLSEGKNELSLAEDFISVRNKASLFYFLGDFRKQLQAEDITDPRQFVKMRKSVLLRTIKPEFVWDNFLIQLQNEIFTKNTLIYGNAYTDSSTFLQLYEKIDQSDVVLGAFLETKLGYVFVKKLGEFLFFHNSEGRIPDCISLNTDPIETKIFQRLLPDKRSTIKEISLINGDFANHSSRRQVLSTDSLEIVPSGLSDYAQICSTVTGTVRVVVAGEQKKHRRYLSFTTSRLSERNTSKVSFTEFETWLVYIKNQLEKQVSIDDTLLRYAKSAKYSVKSKPQHILFDFTSESIDSSGMTSLPTPPNSQGFWLVKDDYFYGEIEDKIFKAKLTFNSEREQYEIASSELDKVSITLSDESSKSLQNYLNETQNFRILLDESKVYTQGKFFTPNLRPWQGGGKRLNINNIVVGCKGLEGITSEKGKISGWEAESVFGAIVDKTQVFKAVDWEPQYLVCNDMGKTEMADFLGYCEQTKKLVMIHAKKAEKDLSLSASAFHEICSQAIRYLGFFNPSDTDTKLTEKKLLSEWRPDKSIYQGKDRIVSAPPGTTAKQIVEKFNSAIADPNLKREVWLVMGNGLSKKAFEHAMSKKAPRSNEREISYLFQSTWCAVASVGASLKIVCMR